MSDPTTLYEYYTSKGNTLPMISTRGEIFEQMNLGLATGYTGTAAQNNMLLAALLEADINHDKLIVNPDLDTTSLLLPSDLNLIEHSGAKISIPLSSTDQNNIRQAFQYVQGHFFTEEQLSWTYSFLSYVPLTDVEIQAQQELKRMVEDDLQYWFKYRELKFHAFFMNR